MSSAWKDDALEAFMDFLHDMSHDLNASDDLSRMLVIAGMAIGLFFAIWLVISIFGDELADRVQPIVSRLGWLLLACPVTVILVVALSAVGGIWGVLISGLLTFVGPGLITALIASLLVLGPVLIGLGKLQKRRKLNKS